RMTASLAAISRRRSRSSARSMISARLAAFFSLTKRSRNATVSSGSLTAICVLTAQEYRSGIHHSTELHPISHPITILGHRRVGSTAARGTGDARADLRIVDDPGHHAAQHGAEVDHVPDAAPGDQ